MVHSEVPCLSLREGTGEHIEPLQLVSTSEHGTYPELSCSDIRSHVTPNKRLSSRWRLGPNEECCVVVLRRLEEAGGRTHVQRHFSSFIETTSSSPCSQDRSTILKPEPDASNPQLALFIPNALILLPPTALALDQLSIFWPTCPLTRRLPTSCKGPTGKCCPKITAPHFQDF